MARSKSSDGSTDETTVAQARFVISLPKDVGPMVDVIGARVKAAVESQTGVTFDMTRAQVVQSVIKSAYAQSVADANGGDDGAGS